MEIQSEQGPITAMKTLGLDGFREAKLLTVNATAYDACLLCTGKEDGITRIGVPAVSDHTVAVDPDTIPLGSKIFIPEAGTTYTAEDTGGAIQGNKIDIYFDSHQEALQFGLRSLTIYVFVPKTVI